MENSESKITPKIDITNVESERPKSNNEKSKLEKSEFQKNKESIIRILKESLSTQLAQAILNSILTTNLVLQLFLITFILGSTSYSSYLVIQSILTYLTYGVSTTTRVFYETPTLFPKITFCNANLFSSQYAYNLVQMGIYSGQNLSIDEKKKLAHDIKDILLNCIYNNEPCSSNDFTWSFDQSYGNCFTFNSGFASNGSKVDLKQTTVSDPFVGSLVLTLYVNFYEGLLNLNDEKAKLLLTGRGAMIRIGNSSYSTFYSNNALLLPAGSVSFLEVAREFKYMLPKPYSNCEIDWNSPKVLPNLELYNLIGQSEYAYTQQLCLIQCLQQKFIEQFNCTFPYLLSLFTNTSACNWHTLDFLFSNWKRISSGDYINQYCPTFCPLECNQTLYETSISSYQLIETPYISSIKSNPNLASDFINRSIDSSNAKESILTVYIFYKSLSYTLTKESPQMDHVALLGSIGGNLGLFWGVSVFSLCEIIQVLIEIVFYFRTKKNNKINESIVYS
jgi:hypothetical protein